MTVATRLPAILNEVGITRGQLLKALAESTVVREGVIQKTKQVQRYWIDITPLMEPDRPHPIQKGSDHIIEQGDAKKSIKIKYTRTHGILTGIVYVDENIAPHYHWLEYGSIHNPVHGIKEKVIAEFEGVR